MMSLFVFALQMYVLSAELPTILPLFCEFVAKFL